MKEILDRTASVTDENGNTGRTGDFSDMLSGLRGATILGINPPVFDFTFFDFWSKPVGLLTILDSLRERGNRVHLVDCIYEGATEPLSFGRLRVEREEVRKPPPFAHIPRRYHRFGMNDEAFLQRLRSVPEPDYILVTSGMTYWYEGVEWCINRLRMVYPSTPVLLGGVYARLCPEHAGRSGADMVQTEPLELGLNRPAMELYHGPSYGVLMTSFGCPMACEYCASRCLFPSFRERSVEEVLSDAGYQFALPGVHHAAFYDDALLIHKEQRFYPLCDALRARFPHMQYHTPNGLHVHEIDARCAEVLRRTGFTTIRLSLESTDPNFQRKGSNKTTAQEFQSACFHLIEAGYDIRRVDAYILAGLPGQSPSSVEESIRFVQSCGARARLAEYSPVPGTPMFDEAASLVPDLRREPLLSNKSVFSTYVSGILAPEEMQRLKNLAGEKT